MGLSRLIDHEEIGGRCERNHKKLQEAPEKAAKYVSGITYRQNNADSDEIGGAYRKSRIIATSGLSAGGIGYSARRCGITHTVSCPSCGVTIPFQRRQT